MPKHIEVSDEVYAALQGMATGFHRTPDEVLASLLQVPREAVFLRNGGPVVWRKTPLGRVRGLGAAKEGVEHWWMVRLTSIALVPLSVWAVFAGLRLAAAPDYGAAVAWIRGTPACRVKSWAMSLIFLFGEAASISRQRSSLTVFP